MPEPIIKFRPVKAEDWKDIAWLASDFVQEADHSDGQDTGWVRNRRSFEGKRYQRIAEIQGQIVGYCSLERSTTGSKSGFRAYLVADWKSTNRSIHEALMHMIEELIAVNKIDLVWMRELTGDVQLLEFVESKGFVKSESYVINGKEMINLRKEYGCDS